ncbi:MAG: FkbM family methyltransferase [Verrucomicrobiae bacterium]|nr:FkbM family methyltransferase [Verrucomicrobiae bacterium]
MSLAGELRKVADRLSTPGAKEARKLRVPLDLYRLYRRLGELTQICTVFDVGANTGEFASWTAKCLPEASIHAFEPLTVCHERLRAAAARHPGMSVHTCALGDRAGMTEMFQNDYSPSSSLLPMEDRHRELWPKTAGDKAVEVEVRTLDDVVAETKAAGPAFLKLDVQGFEMHVLRGAEKALANEVAIVMCETLFEGLYEGQAEFLEMLRFLDERGFRFLEFADERRLGENGRLIYADAVFVRRELRYS